MKLSNLLQIGVVGTSTEDVFLKANILVIIEKDRVRLIDPLTGREIDIYTNSYVVAGSKVTALLPINPEPLDGMVQSIHGGGGAKNQAVVMAEILRKRGANLNIHLFDSAPYSTVVQQECMAAGVRYHAFHRHNHLYNLIFQCERDKATVRSPVNAEHGADHDSALINRLRKILQDPYILACISPKDAYLAGQIWEMAGQQTRNLQPTNEITDGLVSSATTFALNCTEAYELVSRFGIDISPMHESAPAMPEQIAVLFDELFLQRKLCCGIAAVTRGRYGMVLVDLFRGLFYSIEIDVKIGCHVDTPSGAGDLFNAAWIIAREVDQIQEPDASIAATHFVAQRLGLDRNDYTLVIDSSRIPGWKERRVKKKTIGMINTLKESVTFSH